MATYTRTASNTGTVYFDHVVWSITTNDQIQLVHCIVREVYDSINIDAVFKGLNNQYCCLLFARRLQACYD